MAEAAFHLNRSRLVLQAVLPQLPGVGLLVFHPRVMLVTSNAIYSRMARLLSFFCFATASLRRRQESRFHIFIPKRIPCEKTSWDLAHSITVLKAASTMTRSILREYSLPA